MFIVRTFRGHKTFLKCTYSAVTMMPLKRDEKQIEERENKKNKNPKRIFFGF